MFGWGWHHEAGIHLLRLMLSCVFDKYPNLQVISGHWGGMLPFWLQRLDDSLPLAATGLSRTLTRTFQEHVYVTPSGMLTLPLFQFIYALMGAEKHISIVCPSTRLKKRPSRFAMQNVYWASRRSSPDHDDWAQ